jgi:magnesium transporter
MIRDVITFHNNTAPQPLNKTVRGSLKTPIAAAKRAGGFVWIGLEDPDEGEMNELAEQLGLHPLATRDATTGKQQPKVQSYDEHLFVVMWQLHESRSSRLNVGELFLFVREGLLVTVQREMGKHPLDIPTILDATETSLGTGAVGGLYGIMANVANTYSDVASEVEKDLERLERQVFDENAVDDSATLYRVRQELGKLQRTVSSLAKALETSRDRFDQLTIGNKVLEPYLRDLLDDLAGTAQLISDQGAALDGVVSSHENNVASQQNDDTRKISAFAALLSVPTVLAGLYGMNFKNLPGVTWNYGWEMLIAVIIVLDVVMFINFKRRHWL